MFHNVQHPQASSMQPLQGVQALRQGQALHCRLHRQKRRSWSAYGDMMNEELKKGERNQIIMKVSQLKKKPIAETNAKNLSFKHIRKP